MDALVIEIRTHRDVGAPAVGTGITASDVDGLHRTWQVPESLLTESAHSLARSPDEVFEALGRAVFEHVPPRVDSTSAEPVHLRLADQDAARLPWELATVGSIPLLSRSGIDAVLRRTTWEVSSDDDVIASPAVVAKILSERKDRGHVVDLLANLYDEHASAMVGRRSEGLAGLSLSVEQDVRIVHLVVEPVRRRNIPALRLSAGDHLTAESLARVVSGQARLLILDLALDASEPDVAEQVMIANAFCWHLVRHAPDLAVLCGVFGGANDRVGSLRTLVDLLATGTPLAVIAGELQRARPLLPGGRHPLRDFVSLSTDFPHRRFDLGTPR